MEYIIMLQRAWQILTRHKVMWLFGLIAVLAGQDALFNLHGLQIAQPIPEAIIDLPQAASGLVRALTSTTVGFIWIAVTILVGLGLLFIGVLASAALINLAQSAERGNAVTFKEGWRTNLQYIDRLLVVRLIFNLPFILLSFVGVLLLLGGPETTSLISILLIITLGVGVFVGAIGIGTDRAIVIDGMGLRAALRQGWVTLREHIGKYVIITGIFTSTLLLFTLILFCPVALLFADRIAALAQTTPLSTDLTATLWTEPTGIVLIMIGVLLYAGFTAFTSITWTIAYRRYAR